MLVRASQGCGHSWGLAGESALSLTLAASSVFVSLIIWQTLRSVTAAASQRLLKLCKFFYFYVHWGISTERRHPRLTENNRSMWQDLLFSFCSFRFSGLVSRINANRRPHDATSGASCWIYFKDGGSGGLEAAGKVKKQRCSTHPPTTEQPADHPRSNWEASSLKSEYFSKERHFCFNANCHKLQHIFYSLKCIRHWSKTTHCLTNVNTKAASHTKEHAGCNICRNPSTEWLREYKAFILTWRRKVPNKRHHIHFVLHLQPVSRDPTGSDNKRLFSQFTFL